MAEDLNKKTITSKSTVEAKDNVVVNPVVHQDPEFVRAATSSDVEAIKRKPGAELTMEDILTDAVAIVDYRLPNFLDVQPKDRTWVFRWVNKTHDGEGGNRYLMHRAMGWVNVEDASEIDGPISDFVSVHDKTITHQDVILMKMPRARLYGMYKANLVKSNKMFNQKAVHDAARTEGVKSLNADLPATGVPKGVYSGKVGIFVPGANDMPGDVGGGSDIGTPGSHQGR